MTARYYSSTNTVDTRIEVACDESPREFKRYLRLAFKQAEREITAEYKRELHKVDPTSPERQLAQRYTASRSFRLSRRVRWFGRHAALRPTVTSFRAPG